jgi:hypothetical protein
VTAAASDQPCVGDRRSVVATSARAKVGVRRGALLGGHARAFVISAPVGESARPCDRERAGAATGTLDEDLHARACANEQKHIGDGRDDQRADDGAAN